MKVLVWTENVQEKQDYVKKVYPDGIGGEIAKFLSAEEDIEAKWVTLDMPECGLDEKTLNETDVLFWWGHCAHDKVPDEIVERVKERVLYGMGLVVLHSGHYSKIFRALLGTACSLRWRDHEFERVWNMAPYHPIAKGIPAMFELDDEEMYGEFFDIPKPDDVVFGGWFDGGEIFRSGVTFTRGAGKIFYFQPGHETNRAYYNPYVRQILINAAHWAAPVNWRTMLGCPHDSRTTNEISAAGEDVQGY